MNDARPPRRAGAIGLRALLGYAWPYRASLALCGLLMVAESGVGLSVPWLGGQVAGGLLERNLSVTGQLLLILLALFAVQALIKFGTGYLSSRAEEHILADLRVRIYDHLQSLPLAYYQQRRQGEILALLTHDVGYLGGFISETLLSVIPLCVTSLGALVFMYGIDPRLATLAALLIPLFYLVMKIVGRRLRPLARQLQEAHAGAVAIAEENLGMLPAIKTFTREPFESERYRRQVGEILDIGMRQRLIHAGLEPLIGFLAACAILIVLWYAGERIGVGDMQPSDLVSFLLYAGLLTTPVSALADLYGQTQTARGAVERLMQALDEQPEPFARHGRILERVRGEIEFRDVRFAYPGRPATLDGIDLRIAAGETVAIVGPNGAGKSTLGHLLTRLHLPDSGNILIDGRDISEISLLSLRRQIGVVPQHVLLFNGTARDNIAYGQPDPKQVDIEAAARAARAHDFIMALPQGYDTRIGDRGVRLSGGQQQRLALARALLKNPAILILDEATAMFDPQGESEFLAECHEALSTRTVLLITHRPASLALADRIVRMENGRMEGDFAR